MSSAPPRVLQRLAALLCLVAYAAGSAVPCEAGPPPEDPHATHHHASHATEEASGGAADAVLALSAPCDCGCQGSAPAAGSGSGPAEALRLAMPVPLPPWSAVPPAETQPRAVGAPARALDHVPIHATA